MKILTPKIEIVDSDIAAAYNALGEAWRATESERNGILYQHLANQLKAAIQEACNKAFTMGVEYGRAAK